VRLVLLARRPTGGLVLWCSVLQCVPVCRSVSQCVAVDCSVLQCVAMRCSLLRGIFPHTTKAGSSSGNTPNRSNFSKVSSFVTVQRKFSLLRISTIVGALGVARRPTSIHTRTHTHTHTHTYTYTYTHVHTNTTTHTHTLYFTNTHTHTHTQLKIENFWTRIRCSPPKLIFSKVSTFIIDTLKLIVR